MGSFFRIALRPIVASLRGEERKLDGVVDGGEGGQTPPTSFFVKREIENSRREQGRIIDVLEDEQIAHSSQVEW